LTSILKKRHLRRRRIDDDGKFLGDSFMPWQLDYPDVLGVNPGIMSFLYTRKCFDRTGPYRLDLEGVEDVELWVWIASHTGGKIERA
jgi:hypothetical protein